MAMSVGYIYLHRQLHLRYPLLPIDLLNYKDLTTYSQEFVELVCSQFWNDFLCSSISVIL